MQKKILFNRLNHLILLIFVIQLIFIKSQEDESSYESIIQPIVTILSSIISNVLFLSDLEDKGYYLGNRNNYFYVITYADKQSGSDGSIKFPQVNISEKCLSKLKSGHDEEKIVIAKIFRKYQNDLNNEAGITGIADIIYYKFFYINEDVGTVGDPIDIISKCGEKVTYYLPIYSDSDDALKNKFVSVRGQNPSEDIEDLRDYDIFDPDSKFYKDICARITYSDASENVVDIDSFDNYDITLKERRKYYFPGNTALCPNNFDYLGVDKNTFSSMCETAFKNYEGSTPGTTGYDVHNEYTSFEYDDEDFKSSHRDVYFTMGVLKCINLPFTKKGFRGNYGSYFIIALIIIIAICYAILLLSGKYHLLSVLELLFNSNIKSMNYLKNSSQNNPLTNNSNLVIPYDVRSNNNLGMSHQTMISNGQLLSNTLSGNNFLYYNNPSVDKVSISKKSNSANNNLKKNEKEKKDLMSNVDEQENDFESEKGKEEKDNTNIYNDSIKDVNILNVKNKEKDEKDDKNKKDVTPEKNDEQEKEEKVSKKEDDEDEGEEEGDEEDDNEESESNRDYKNKLDKNKDKSNPPKKSINGGGQEEENGKKEKKRKSKNPIEISLNVKDLRDMMFKDQIPRSMNTKEEPKQVEREKSEKKLKSKPKKKSKNNNDDSNTNANNNNYNNNLPPNGYPFPYLPPIGMIPPYGMPPYQYNGGQSSQNEETKNLKRELEYQKELNERREREMRKEREEMLERERERQRQRDLDFDRERRLRDMEMMYGNKGMGMERFENVIKKNNGVKRGSALWNDDSNDTLMKEREKFSKEQDKFNKIKEQLEDELKKKNEENNKMQYDLNLIKGDQEKKQIEYEKLLLQKEQELKEKFEKEKKEIIDSKNREIQILREDKDREIQRLKEDKDKEIDSLKQDMQKEMKKKDDKIKKKEKVIEKQKKETQELKKDLTTGTFYTNNISPTSRPNNFDYYGIKREEKLESPQVVISINSIFTDQELNAMDFEESCQFDKRSLCQVYLCCWAWRAPW